METPSILFGIGTVIFAIGAILAAVGTTSTGLFLFYGVLAVGGLGIMAVARKMKDAR